MGTLQSVLIEAVQVQQSWNANALIRDNDWGFAGTSGDQVLDGLRLMIRPPGTSMQVVRTSQAASCRGTGGLTSGASCRIQMSGTYRDADQSRQFNAPSSVLAFYIGAGTFNIGLQQFATLTTRETGGSSDNEFVDNRYGFVSNSGTLRVTYDYLVVPLPAGVWLFASGLLGIATIVRRNRLRAAGAP